MAVPKKRTGSSAQGHRRSNWKATKPEVTNCAKCNAIIPTHTVCPECGYYKGKAVSIKHADFNKDAAVKTEKKAPKSKSADKKTTKAKSEEPAIEKPEEAKVVEKVTETPKAEEKPSKTDDEAEKE